MTKTMIGLFSDKGHAEKAVQELEEMGYDAADFSVVMKQDNRFHEEAGTDVGGGAVAGAATGGVIGALAGLTLATGIIPGIGALLVAGPIATALGLTGAAATAVTGAATGAAAGGLLGALSGLGLKREDAEEYERRVSEGGVLIAIPVTNGRDDEIRSVLEEHHASQVKTIEQDDSGHYAHASM